MITRIWHGRTNPENQDKYLQFLLTDGTKEYRETPGNRAVKVWKKSEDDACHFWTVTEWDDIHTVKSFAGEDFEKAVYYPEDDGILLEFEECVNHYEVFDVSNTRIKNYINKFEQSFCGGSWLDESFTEKLKDITDKDFFEAPIPGVHSVAEILWHVIYWRTVLIKRILGDLHYREETIEQFNFLPLESLKAKGRTALWREFEETQTSLIKLLGDKTDGFLDQEFRAGQTYEYLTEGELQHDIYHLGQIGLVLKILKVNRATTN